MKNLLQKLKWFFVPRLIKTLTHHTASNHRELKNVKKELYKIKRAIGDVNNTRTRGYTYSKKFKKNGKKEVTEKTGRKE